MNDDDAWCLEEAEKLTSYINNLTFKQQHALRKYLPKNYKCLSKELLLEIWQHIKEIEGSKT